MTLNEYIKELQELAKDKKLANAELIVREDDEVTVIVNTMVMLYLYLLKQIRIITLKVFTMKMKLNCLKLTLNK